MSSQAGHLSTMEAKAVARRTEWVVSALAHHYGYDQGSANEIVVLSLGVDQYIQEVFNNLDYDGDGVVTKEYFCALCEILGVGLPDDLSAAVDFKEFHLRLCERVLASFGVLDFKPLALDENHEYVTTSIKLNKRKAECSADTCVTCSMCIRDLVNSLLVNKFKLSFTNVMRNRMSKSLTKEQNDCFSKIEHIWRSIVEAYETLQKRIVSQEEEVEGLRELIEDLRAALQSSDARCLAFQVELLRLQKHMPPNLRCWSCRAPYLLSAPPPKTHRSVKNLEIRNGRIFRLPVSSSVEIIPYVSVGKDSRGVSYVEKYQHYSPRCVETLVREMFKLRNNRDAQIQEARYLTEDLQYEVRKKGRSIEHLQKEVQELVQRQRHMFAELGKARVILQEGLERVREIEKEAKEVPLLKDRVRFLEKKVQHER